ncbi:hypothetical protein EV359DRAFT_85582 [Lentinula novae-zelandiae]|nr:hypothetical protein EV359DRAFT_85582 [Lentinula novae-zelandiae]
MRHNKHSLFSKHKCKNSGKLRSSSMASSQKIGSSSRAKASNTGHETEAEEAKERNSEEDLEEPEDSHAAQVLRNITQKGKGTPTLARQVVVASIKASSTSSKKPTKVYWDLTSLVDVGCAQIATIGQPMVFDQKDTDEEVADKLRALCPLVMEYADSRFMYRKKSNPEYPKHDSDPGHAYLPEIILCKKDCTYGMLPLTGPSAFFPDGEMLWRIATKHGFANKNEFTREPISKRRLGLFQEAIQKAKQMKMAPVTAFYTLNENTELSTEEDIIGEEGEEEDTTDEDQRDYQETEECKETEAEETTNEGMVHGNSEEEEELVEDALRPPFTQKRLRSEFQPSGEDEHPAKKRKGKSHGSFRSYSSSEHQSQTETEEAEEDTNTPKPRSRAFLRKTGSPHMRSILRNADRARKFFGVTVDEVEDDLGFRMDYSSDQEYASDLFQKPNPSTPQVNTSATASTSQASTSTSSNSMAAFLTYYKPPLSDKSRERLNPWKQV